MSTVNYTFGVLSDGLLKPRFSNSLPSSRQSELLKSLWDATDNKGNLAEFLIRFLRCSEHWPKYCQEFDQLNTYHIPVDLPEFVFKFSDLVKWADDCPHLSSDFPVNKNQTAIDRVTNRLFGVLTIK